MSEAQTFCRMIQQVAPNFPSYQQLLTLGQQQDKPTSRKDYSSESIQGLPEAQWFQLYRIFISHIETHDKGAANSIRGGCG